MNKIIIGNLKMYMTYEEVIKYVEDMEGEAIICPSSLYVPFFLNHSYQVGLQDVSMYDLGSHTGDISAKQAIDMGVTYTLVGHSERRKYQHETDEMINAKIKKALDCGLRVVFCVGEEQNEDKTQKLQRQLLAGLKDIHDLSKLIVAYEPIWCIGSGQTPTNDEIETTIAFIQTIISQNFHQSVKVLYGGSVDISNIDTLNQVENVDGFLIGKASTDSKQFKEIIKKI